MFGQNNAITPLLAISGVGLVLVTTSISHVVTEGIKCCGRVVGVTSCSLTLSAQPCRQVYNESIL